MEDVERKLELTRYLRQEQNLNRMKVKNREDILYGTGKNSEMLYGDDGLELAEYDRIREQGHKGPMFGLRLAVSLMLFAGVIYLDKNQIDWKGQSAVAVISRQLETSVMGNSTVEATKPEIPYNHTIMSIFKMGKICAIGALCSGCGKQLVPGILQPHWQQIKNGKETGKNEKINIKYRRAFGTAAGTALYRCRRTFKWQRAKACPRG